jgi:hypothetical protein
VVSPVEIIERAAVYQIAKRFTPPWAQIALKGLELAVEAEDPLKLNTYHFEYPTGIAGWIHEKHFDYGWPYHLGPSKMVQGYWPFDEGITGQAVEYMPGVGTPPADWPFMEWFNENYTFLSPEGVPRHGGLKDVWTRIVPEPLGASDPQLVPHWLPAPEAVPRPQLPYRLRPYQPRDPLTEVGPEPEWEPMQHVVATFDLYVHPAVDSSGLSTGTNGSRGVRPVSLSVSSSPPPRAPPKAGEKEQKKHAGVKGGLATLIGAITEANDAIGAIWKSIPGKKRDYHGPTTRPDQKYRDIINHFADIDWGKAVVEMINQHYQDRLRGRLSGAINHYSQPVYNHFGMLHGWQTGPWDSGGPAVYRATKSRQADLKAGRSTEGFIG